MRLTLTRELMPTLHTSSYMAWKARVDDSSGLDPVIAGFRDQARVVGVGVQAILSRCVEENASVIIDGVHLLPGFFDLAPYRKEAFIAPLCLALADRDAYEERFANRAVEAPARAVHQYVSHLDEILKVQSDIVEWCANEDIPVIDPDSVEDVTSAAVMVVLAIPFVFGNLRSGSMGRNLFIGIMAGLVFYVVNKAFGYIVLGYGVSPIIGAVLPTIILFVASLFMYRRVA